MTSDPPQGNGSGTEPAGSVSASDEDTLLLGDRGGASGGRLVANRYRVTRKLGMGGFGEVFEALDTTLDRRVALKVLRADRLNPADRARFLREARATAKLRHQHVALLYDVLEDAGAIYLVLELVLGQPLNEILRKGSLASERALAIAADVLEGLKAAHALRIVHRDVKPANIIVTPEGAAKLTDFGIARLLDEANLTATDAIVGTPAYMAPEQIEGQRGTEAADLWALGCVLHEMLSGTKAFEGESASAVIAAILAGKPRQLPPANDELDREAQQITLALLNRDVATRNEGARKLSESTRRAAGDHVQTTRFQRPRLRRPLVAAAILTVACIVVTALAFVLWRNAVHLRSAPPSTALTFDFRSFELQYWQRELGPACTPLTVAIDSGHLKNDFLRSVASQTDLNVFLAPRVPDSPVSAHIANLAWPLALRSVLDEQKLAFIVRSNVIVICTEEHVRDNALTRLLVYQTDADDRSAPSAESIQRWLSKWGRVTSTERRGRRLWFVEDLPIRVAFVSDCLRKSGVIAGMEEQWVSTWTCPWRPPEVRLPRESALLIGFRPLEAENVRGDLVVNNEEFRDVIARIAEPAGLSYRVDSSVRGTIIVDFRAADQIEALDILLRDCGVHVRCDGGVLVFEYGADPMVEASFAPREQASDETIRQVRQFVGPAAQVSLSQDGLIRVSGTDGDILRAGIVSGLLDAFATER